ncbi:MAG: trypsin-like peptidase domain-containing protein [Acidimicrobiia bacterium]|nr:trypsin-like peptidase domain-containing protein [Acidimicrobiia bacterium]
MSRVVRGIVASLLLFGAACSHPSSSAYPNSDVVQPAAVRVLALACGFVSEGVGVFVAPDLVVTNAHVVAGGEQIQVRAIRNTVDAVLVGFDPNLDLALLRTRGQPPDIFVPTIALKDPVQGDIGLVAVFSDEGSFVTIPYKVTRAIVASGTDIYGKGKHLRRALGLDTTIRPGDSGAALFDEAAAVVGIAFASSRNGDGVTYAIAASELRSFLDATDAGSPVDSGACY